MKPLTCLLLALTLTLLVLVLRRLWRRLRDLFDNDDLH